MKKILASIVIPVIEINDYLRRETIPAILKQTCNNFEILIITDKKSKEKFSKTKIIPSWPKTGPADKRDLGVKKAKGEIIAFLDDDSYPEKTWLWDALRIFDESKEIAGVCGPTLTPSHNNLRQKASGYVWSTWLGSGGAGTYRCAISPRREVDDYPSVNLLIRKKDFLTVGGFDSHFWPGEDTKLCHDLVYEAPRAKPVVSSHQASHQTCFDDKLGKKIIYDPKILVYHHRRAVFRPHLIQISRYAIHRGHFARILPKTSLRFGYLIPSLFVLGLFGGPILIFVLKLLGIYRLVVPLFLFYLLSLIVYLFLLLATAAQVCLKEKNLKLALLVIPAIFITHIVYGVLFIKGFFSKKLER
ncbi:MAG: glycosyltransferase [Candidatus Shapirobacteria bacterium]|nr:glycosyltransferase [Candidatus Shapirobacteria bacterium]